MSELENRILEQLSRIDSEEAEAFQESMEDETEEDPTISNDDYRKYMVE